MNDMEEAIFLAHPALLTHRPRTSGTAPLGVVLASYAFHAKVPLGAPFFLVAGTITHNLVRVRNAAAFSMEQHLSCVVKRLRLIGFSDPVAASNLKCNTVSYKVLRCTKEPSTSNYNLKSA